MNEVAYTQFARRQKERVDEIKGSGRCLCTRGSYSPGASRWSTNSSSPSGFTQGKLRVRAKEIVEEDVDAGLPS